MDNIHKKSLYIAVKAFKAPPIDRSCKNNKIIEYVIIRKVKG
jgi:hypothetical protein